MIFKSRPKLAVSFISWFMDILRWYVKWESPAKGLGHIVSFKKIIY